MCVGGGGGDRGGIGATRESPAFRNIMEGSNILGIQLFRNKSDTLNKDL